MTFRWVHRLALAGLAATTGCTDSLLNVDSPDVIQGNGTKGETGAAALFEGARSEFIAAHDGDGSTGGPPTSLGLVYVTGLFTDEFRFPATPPDLINIDRRDLQRTNGSGAGVFLVLHRARTAAAAAAAAALEALPTAATDPRLGEAKALEGLIYTLFGETFCSGVPFSRNVKGTIEPGSPITTAQMFQEALTRLDAAVSKAGGDPDVANLIRVGRGRTLLNLGRFADAAAAVATVPSGFVYDNTHTTADPRATNNIKSLMWDTFFLGMADSEGTNGLDFVSAADSRVESVDAGVSDFDLQTEVFRFLPYQSGSAPVRFASGVEARLIEAEAALKAADQNRWLSKLNEARAVASLDPLTDPGTERTRVDLMFRERAFSLYGTSHRLGDLRRLVRQYARDAETVFPTGDYHKDNLVRSNQVAIPVPQTEENNPNYQPSACDPTKA